MTEAATQPSFDLTGPLPSGITVLEASAGTGKTFTIAGLAARYVAEGVPLSNLLLVTFTRMATGELRERVRERLVASERGLSRVIAGAPEAEPDPVVSLLAKGSTEEVEARRSYLAHAVAQFDAATIATTHGFCQEVLGGLGIVGEATTDTAFLEDADDLVTEVVDDLFVRRFHNSEAPRFGLNEARLIGTAVVKNPSVNLEPKAAPQASAAAMRFRLANAVRDEFEVRKRRLAVMTYDDLLTRLDETLAGPEGAVASQRLRSRYRIVLVDEFQDTDPVQWDIMRRAFGHDGGTLILIGDPKQAIYAFRGADVYAYLEASNAAAVRATLDINWRSDQGLIDAYDALFSGATLGHPGIVYRKVQASTANQQTGLHDAPVAEPLRVRLVHRADEPIELTNRGYASADSVRGHIAADLAADLAALLSSGAQVEARPDTPPRSTREAVRPGHVAVLVRTHRNASLIRDRLEAVGIPAVINGAGSVFGTESARDWLRLLEAIERPAASTRARSSALTPFFGWTAERIATATDADWEDVHRRLHHWSRVLRTNGVAALADAVLAEQSLPGRILKEAEGERRLTDLRHIAQLLHGEVMAEQLGPSALTAWLRQRITAEREENSDEERTRRLESDAEAVQVLTIHRSKGLEFPIVYCPDLWQPSYIPRDPAPVLFHDPSANDTRTIDVALEGEDFNLHRKQSENEQRGEDLRLAYVALTRARHQAVIWWAGSWDSRDSSLGRLLFARDESGEVAPAGSGVPTDGEATARFQSLAAQAPGCVSIERSTVGKTPHWSAGGTDNGELSTAAFDRHLDFSWRRTSFSDITSGTHGAQVASEPEQDALSDEPNVPAGAPAPSEPDEDKLRNIDLPLALMPAGLRVGTFVHEVLEAADFCAKDLDAELQEQVEEIGERRRLDLGDPAEVVHGLRAMLETPLGPLVENRCLREIASSDRLDEMEFEMPLAGGDEPTGSFTVDALADLLNEHLTKDDPMLAYVARLSDPELRASVRGYLTGSIDSAVRLHRNDGALHFAVIDYKTNWLAPDGEKPTAWHYRPDALAAEIVRGHYGLQALLYSAALHRYLRWRLPAYDPAQHFAGVLYLFVRGMIGGKTPVVDGSPCGVFGWRPSEALLEGLSDVLDTGGPR